ncbi:hypothetical protein [Nonomuraea sp. NPDC049141]|uniref:hypothetical protein n=1 Tax=Nonomuraea sp. NPDC049141 TaxID=3155500 RepID=UPI00340C4984
MPLEREGGQAQFIVTAQPPVPQGSLLEPVLSWVEDNLAEEVTLAAMAGRSGLSERTFSRRFRERFKRVVGVTPRSYRASFRTAAS